MRLLRVCRELYCRPLLIDRSGFDTIHNVVQAKLRGERPSFISKLVGSYDESDEEEDDELYGMEIFDGVAWIPVNGPLGKKLSLLEKVSGTTDVDDLRENLDLAATHPDVETIVLEFDSPGGSVSGIPELASRIKQINIEEKPCIALVDGMCCSAAYYLAAGCSEILAIGKTSYCGSIGVYTYALDTSRKMQNAGEDPVLIKSGKNKGEMLPGLPISEDTKARLQKEVDYIYQLFTSHVVACRPGVGKESMEGEAFFAEESVERGLIDLVIDSKKELFQK